MIIELLLSGYLSNREAFLEAMDSDCYSIETLNYVLASNPEHWKARFKRARSKDYQPPVGNSLYYLPEKRIRAIIDTAKKFGVDLE